MCTRFDVPNSYSIEDVARTRFFFQAKSVVKKYIDHSDFLLVHDKLPSQDVSGWVFLRME